MNDQNIDPIELAVIAFLQRVGAPNVPSQIAVYNTPGTEENEVTQTYI